MSRISVVSNIMKGVCEGGGFYGLILGGSRLGEGLALVQHLTSSSNIPFRCAKTSRGPHSTCRFAHVVYGATIQSWRVAWAVPRSSDWGMLIYMVSLVQPGAPVILCLHLERCERIFTPSSVLIDKTLAPIFLRRSNQTEFEYNGYQVGAHDKLPSDGSEMNHPTTRARNFSNR
jgi:hypothetical protein